MENLFVILLVCLAVFTALILIYNSIIYKKNQVKSIKSSVDVQLKKRYDLIPNLVSCVKEIMVHEKDILIKITQLRSMAMSTQDEQKVFELNNQISKALGDIKIAIEAYPQIKSNQNMILLQKTLNEIEEQISAARRTYNSSVMIYNNALEMFPSNIIANCFKFKKADFFQIEKSHTNNPDIAKILNDK